LGGIFLLKLNTSVKLIVYKYCEGKLKRTLKKESKEPENDYIGSKYIGSDPV